MAIQTTFAEILKAAEQLPLEDQENLIHILQNRLRDQKRTELVRDVQQALELLCENPFTPKLRNHKLKGDLQDSYACSALFTNMAILFELLR